MLSSLDEGAAEDGCWDTFGVFRMGEFANFYFICFSRFMYGFINNIGLCVGEFANFYFICFSGFINNMGTFGVFRMVRIATLLLIYYFRMVTPT